MRRRRHEEHTNHEAWAIPYADLMTLLLAFFVVMYAVSVVNEGKYRVASEALAEAFNGSNRVAVPDASSKLAPRKAESAKTAQTAAARAAAAESPDLAVIEDQVRAALQTLIDRNLVTVRHGTDRLEIEIRTDVLFPSGVAQLSPSAGEVLRSMAAILAPFPNALRVEGYTDNVPIATPMFPSNWELSAARAASVARLFIDHGVAPARLGIMGWGEVRPLTDNATEDGRNRNRRVLVVVMGGTPSPVGPASEDAQMDAASALDAAGAKLAGAPAAAAAPPPPQPAAASAMGGDHAAAGPGVATPAAGGHPATGAGAMAPPAPAAATRLPAAPAHARPR